MLSTQTFAELMSVFLTAQLLVSLVRNNSQFTVGMILFKSEADICVGTISMQQHCNFLESFSFQSPI